MDDTKKRNGCRWLTVVFFITLLAAAAMVLYGGKAFSSGDVRVVRESAEELSGGWYYMSGNDRVEISALPAVIREEGTASLTLYRALPDSLPRDAALCLDSYQQVVEAYLGEDCIYQYGVEDHSPAGRILGSVWNLIDLPEPAAGGVLAVRLTAFDYSGEWNVPVVLLGSRAAVAKKLFFSRLNVAVFSLIVYIAGFVLLLLSLLLKGKKLFSDREGLVHLGIFMQLSALWIATDSQFLQFFVGNKAAVYLASFASFMLLPVPLLFFIRQVCRHGQRAFDVLSLLYILNFFVQMGLYLLGAASLMSTLPVTHILVGVTVVFCLFFCLRERFYYQNKDADPVIAGACCLAVGATLSLLFYRIQLVKDNSLFFRCGLAVFLALLCYSSGRRSIRLLRARVTSETYRTLAFTDTMTETANRLAFERDAEELQQEEPGGDVCVAMVDINNLKQVNDTYGHMTGDELIRSTARCIREVLDPLGRCYRIGGDEFVVLMKNQSEESVRPAMARLRKAFACCKTENPEGLSVAVGFASAPAEGPNFVQTLFKKADARMYEQKQQQEAEKHPE